MEKFWMVAEVTDMAYEYLPVGAVPRRMHATRESAEREALRLHAKEVREAVLPVPAFAVLEVVAETEFAGVVNGKEVYSLNEEGG